MEKNKFEIRQKSIVKIFNIIFWCGVLNVASEIILKVLYLVNAIKFDLTEYNLLGYVISFVYLGIMYLNVNLAKKGSVFAGIIGIIVGFLEILIAGFIWKIIGALLLIDSIMYLVNYKKYK